MMRYDEQKKNAPDPVVVLGKVRKLLALAGHNSFHHEANRARSKAREILDRYSRTRVPSRRNEIDFDFIWQVMGERVRGKLSPYEADLELEKLGTKECKPAAPPNPLAAATAATEPDYVRFRPHPKKYKSNAARQKAYRDRHRESFPRYNEEKTF